MSDSTRDDRVISNQDQHVPPEAVAGAHDADGTMGRVAGTGSGALSGGIIGAAVGGPIGAVVGAVAGAALGHAGGDAAHKIGDDHDDVNVQTGSGGDLGKNAGAGAGSISGAIVGSTVGPVGTVVGAVAGGMLGAAAGDAAKDVGDTDRDTVFSRGAGYAHLNDPIGTDLTPINTVPTLQTGVTTSAVGAMGTGSELPRVSRSEYEGLNDEDRMRVQLVEEELHVGKEMRQSGEVQVSKRVAEEQVQVPVTLQREEVVVTRHDLNQPVDAATVGTAFQDETIRVPVHAEVAQVTKTAHVVEEIEINKHAVSAERTVSDTVRRQELDVHRGTGAAVGTQSSGTATVGTDTRGVAEKAADAVTGDHRDDKTGNLVV